MGQLTLVEPFEIGRDGKSVILVARADLGKLRDIDTMAQLWRPGDGYGPPTPLQVMFKFMYSFTEAVAPIPWVEPTA